MRQKRIVLQGLIGLLIFTLALPPGSISQESSPQPPKFKEEELAQLVAPIALHPDSLLTQILMASTYPLEVVQAERWMKQNKSLKGDALKAALDKQPWDNSVKSLVPFPEVLTMMSEKLEWTQKLGDAFLAQQKDVMDMVQKLRRKADEEGNLKSSKEQEVKKEGDIIIVQPTNPEVIYVPTYNPTVVYGAWYYPAYPPYPVYVYPPGAALFTFSMGIMIGAAWHGGGCYPDYHGGNVNIDNSTNINIDRPDKPGKPETRPSGGGGQDRAVETQPGAPERGSLQGRSHGPEIQPGVECGCGQEPRCLPGKNGTGGAGSQSGRRPGGREVPPTAAMLSAGVEMMPSVEGIGAARPRSRAIGAGQASRACPQGRGAPDQEEEAAEGGGGRRMNRWDLSRNDSVRRKK